MVKLEKIEIFKYLSKKEINYISQYLKSVDFLPGDEVIHQGKANQNLYIVDSGLFRVHIILPGDYLKEIFQLSEGNFFGEMSMLAGSLSTASVTAKTAASCIFLTRDILNSIRYLKPKLAIKIEMGISELSSARINQNIKKTYEVLEKLESKIVKSKFASFQSSPTDVPKNMSLDQLNRQQLDDIEFFKYLDKQKWKSLLSAFEITSVSRGHQFYFDKNTYLGIVFQGAVQYLIKYSDHFQKNLDVIGPGGVFGQQTFFGDYSPYLRLYSREDAIVLILHKTILDELRNTDEELWQQIIHYLCLKTVSMLYAIDREYARIESQYGDLLSQEDN